MIVFLVQKRRNSGAAKRSIMPSVLRARSFKEWSAATGA
jgi:hypothetical protein